MIYLFCEIANYKQLFRINPELLKLIDEKMTAVIKQNDISPVSKKQGMLLAAAGDEKKKEPKDVLESAFDLLSLLENEKAELYGFSVLLIQDSDTRVQVLENRARTILSRIFDTDGLWVPKSEWEYWSRAAVGEESGEMMKIVRTVTVPPVYNTIAHIPQMRKRIINRLANVVLDWFSSEDNLSCIYVRGPEGVCKSEIVSHVVASLAGSPRLRHLSAIRGSLSAEDPVAAFVMSITDSRESLLKRVPQYLSVAEKTLWKDHLPLFQAFLEKKTTSADFMSQDFFTGYTLYCKAFVSIMADQLLPGIFLLESPQLFPGDVLERFLAMLKDLSAVHRIRLIVISSDDDPVNALRPYVKKRIMVNSFHRDEVFRCILSLYPGIKVPVKIVDQLTRLSRGVYRNILFYVYYLRLAKKIIQDEQTFRWVGKETLPVKIPQKPWHAGVTVIKSLKEEAKTILYISHAAFFLLDRTEMTVLFETVGLAGRKVEEQLVLLESMQLLPVPALPRFSRAVLGFLRSTSRSKTAYLDEQLHKLVTSGLSLRLDHRRLELVRFLLERKDFQSVLSVLPVMLERAIEARNWRLARSLLPGNRGFQAALSQASATVQQKFTLVRAAFELRLLVAEGNITEATKLVKRSLPPTDSLAPDPSYAALYLSLGHYHYCTRQPDKAIDFSKRAMHYYQELDNPERTAESFLDLGAEFLAKGNLREAKDYIAFGKKIAHDQGRACVRMRSLALEGVAGYLSGNYSGLIADCSDGIKICRENGLREYEHFFNFFCARAFFDLGNMETAMGHLHQCLALGTLYDMKNTRPVIFNWIARCALYGGNAELGAEILKSVEDTAESLYFKAEAFSAKGEYKKAVKLLGKAMHMPFDPGPRSQRPVAYEHGWAGIEDLCLDLSTNGSLLFRLLRAFRAYNLCRAGVVNEGLRELHEMTITEKFSPVDPAAFFCYFLYYLVLKSVDKPRDYFEESAHGLTILNKALKHLQERSTAIEDPRDRINYLSRNKWNKMLMDEAKANKLI